MTYTTVFLRYRFKNVIPSSACTHKVFLFKIRIFRGPLEDLMALFLCIFWPIPKAVIVSRFLAWIDSLSRNWLQYRKIMFRGKREIMGLLARQYRAVENCKKCFLEIFAVFGVLFLLFLQNFCSINVFDFMYTSALINQHLSHIEIPPALEISQYNMHQR